MLGRRQVCVLFVGSLCCQCLQHSRQGPPQPEWGSAPLPPPGGIEFCASHPSTFFAAGAPPPENVFLPPLQVVPPTACRETGEFPCSWSFESTNERSCGALRGGDWRVALCVFGFFQCFCRVPQGRGCGGSSDACVVAFRDVSLKRLSRRRLFDGSFRERFLPCGLRLRSSLSSRVRSAYARRLSGGGASSRVFIFSS